MDVLAFLGTKVVTLEQARMYGRFPDFATGQK